MITRVITGAGLLALLLFTLYVGGWLFAVIWTACVLVAVAEMFSALSGRYKLVSWPTWLALLISIPCFLLLDENAVIGALVAVVYFTFLLVCIIGLFRDNPKLDDMLVSVLPLLTVALPGMCLLSMVRLPLNLQRALLGLTFFVPVMGDMAAYFIGVRYGKNKLNPVVSPKKTVEGALAGLSGSTLTGMAVFGVAYALGMSPPPMYMFVVMGFIGGLVGQVGDLFASMVKRHCGIKDYGTIFPGHGGMLDRLDSILFVAVFVFAFQQMVL